MAATEIIHLSKLKSVLFGLLQRRFARLSIVSQDSLGFIGTCLFNLYAEYIMRNAGLEEAQAVIKITGRNINNLRYADDTTLMAESEKELKSLLIKVKEESEKIGLKLTFRKRRSWHPVPSLHGK